MDKILPSILNVKNVESFLKKVKEMNEQGICNIREVHVDMMDGKFVDNLKGNLASIKSIKDVGMFSDVHFMYVSPKNEIKEAIEYGANSITIHYEIEDFEENLEMLKQAKKEYDINIGVSICPETPEMVLDKYINDIDIILVMSVKPGKGGQTFIEETYEKIINIRNMNKSICIIVDGGINSSNILNVLKSGADKVVIGNFLTMHEDDDTIFKKSISELIEASRGY